VVGDTASLAQDGKPLPRRRSGGNATGTLCSEKLIHRRISGAFPATAPVSATFDKGNMAVVGKGFRCFNRADTYE